MRIVTNKRVHSTEAARVMGSPLTTVNMDKSKIGASFPELVRAAEGPVLDTSCAALLRLARAVHQQGYKAPSPVRGPTRHWRATCGTRRRSSGTESIAPGKSGVLQPIMPLDSPVKVRPWELTVYPRSHIRR